MVTRDNVTRFTLAGALIILAAVIGWVGLTRSGGTGPLPLTASALVPLVAAGLLRIRPAVGATLALVAALYGAALGLLLQFCLFCATLPLTAESLALYVVSAAVFGLALVEFRRRGMTWVVAVILAVGLLLSNNIIASGLLVGAAIAWYLVQRRRRTLP